MRFNTIVSALVLATSSRVLAQDAAASATLRVFSDILSQLESIRADSSARVLVSEIDAAVPTSVLAAISGQLPKISNLAEFATDPTSFLTARPTAWETYLPSSVRSAYDAYETSLVNAQASIVASDLGITLSQAASATTSAAMSSSSGGAGAGGARAAWGVAAGVVGVAGFVGAVL